MKQKLIIVPAYNEAANIVGVIADLREHCPGFDIVVINDHSTDGTAAAALAAGVELLDLPVNLGIGGAVQTGFRYAWRHGYDLVVRVDGDGQHRADQIPSLIAPILNGNADCVNGSRFLNRDGRADWPRARRAGTMVFSVLSKLLLRKRITDATSGFRAYSRRVIRHLAEHYPEDYPEPEIVNRLVQLGMRLEEVPVTMRKRGGGTSSITFLKSIYYMVKVVMAVLINTPVFPSRKRSPGTPESSPGTSTRSEP